MKRWVSSMKNGASVCGLALSLCIQWGGGSLKCSSVCSWKCWNVKWTHNRIAPPAEIFIILNCLTLSLVWSWAGSEPSVQEPWDTLQQEPPTTGTRTGISVYISWYWATWKWFFFLMQGILFRKMSTPVGFLALDSVTVNLHKFAKPRQNWVSFYFFSLYLSR